MLSRLLFFICLCGGVYASFIPPHDPLLTTSARIGPSGILHWVEENERPEYRKNYAINLRGK